MKWKTAPYPPAVGFRFTIRLGTAYLHHVEIKPHQWQRIWDDTAPQAMRSKR